MKLKRAIAMLLMLCMVLSLAACSKGGNGTPETIVDANGDAAQNQEQQVITVNKDKKLSSVNIGTWWVQYYDSDDAITDASDYNTALANGDEFNLMIAQMKFDNVPKIEAKYGIPFYWQNLTYAGVKESINTSILAGTPDCEIYLTDAGMAIPAQMNGLALDLKTVLPADDDIFTDQMNIAYLDLGDGKACIFYRQEGQKLVEATYPLGFNMQMLEDNNLEDPRVLWERGEWTWDKFIEYCQVLTQDTDGDGQTDQYGYCGYENETFEQLFMSNGASVASGSTEGLSSAEVGEALQMMYDMYNTYNICYPYDYEGSPSDSMRNAYTTGQIGFFPIAAWIASGNNDYDYNGDAGYTLPFDTAYVRWPVGPSGDAATNAAKNSTSGEFYIIPANVADPETVYGILYDYWNWYDGDTSIRDDKQALNWWYGVTAATEELQNENFAVMKNCGEHLTFDLWSAMADVALPLQTLMKGEMTPAQLQEEYKQVVQDGLDAYYSK